MTTEIKLPRPYRVGDIVTFVRPANNKEIDGVILRKMGNTVEIKHGVDVYVLSVDNIVKLSQPKPK
jgi:hypothetical protein